MGDYLKECERICRSSVPGSEQLFLRVRNIVLADRNLIMHNSGILLKASKGREYCSIGFQLLELLSEPIANNQSQQLVPPKAEATCVCKEYKSKEILRQERVGRGSFGEVWLVKVRGQRMAAKYISSGNTQVEYDRTKSLVMKEVRVMVELNHTNIVRLMGNCLEMGEICILMEHVQRGSLIQVLEKERLPTWRLFQIFRQIVNAMVYAHAHEPHPILHRDLKPANILIDQHYQAKVADMGLATGAGTLSKTSTGGGTVAYDAPEVLDPGCEDESDDSDEDEEGQEDGGIDPGAGTTGGSGGAPEQNGWTKAGDVYSFAVLCWEVLSCKKPWQGAGITELHRKVVLQQKRPHKKRWDKLISDEQQRHKPFFGVLIRDCWAQSSAERPSFEELEVRFETAAPGFPPQPAPEES